MPFTIPNEADAFHQDQAEPDKVDIDILVAGYAGTGVISGCAVTAQGSPDMTVAVASGTVSVAGTQVAVASGNVTITAAHATNPRIDLVVVSNAGAKSVTAGTAAASPVMPEIPASSVVLAAVYVPATDTAIATNQITDKRVMLGASWPLLAPSGLVTAPSYGFASDVDAGMFLNAVGDLRLAVAGAAKVRMDDDGTNGTVFLHARGTGGLAFQHGGVTKQALYSDRVDYVVPLGLAEAAAPSTPAAGYVYLYATTDGVLFAKDDAGFIRNVGNNIKYKTADQATSGTHTTLVNDTHLTFAVEASATYVIEGVLWVFSGATTTGAKVAINGPAIGTGKILFSAVGQITQGAAGAASTFFGNGTNAYDAATTLGASVVGTAATAPSQIVLSGHLKNGSTAGTLALRIAAEANAVITYMEGSWMRLTRVA